MCDQDEEWSYSRYFSERVMSELPDEPGARQAAASTGEQLAAFRLVARRAIEASLERAGELEVAQHRRMIEGSGAMARPADWPLHWPSQYCRAATPSHSCNIGITSAVN